MRAWPPLILGMVQINELKTLKLKVKRLTSQLIKSKALVKGLQSENKKLVRDLKRKKEQLAAVGSSVVEKKRKKEQLAAVGSSAVFFFSIP